MSFSRGVVLDSLRSNSHRMGILPAIMGYQLIITTAAGVYSWSNQGSAQLLSSTSKGIVTSRNMHTDKDLLAVADSQIVVLHNMEKGMQRTYRLRNENQGHIRKLFYHPDRQRLFFTTTLQNAVQSFSLQNAELLDAAPSHPSPPTVFAVSSACDLLVSASTDPPLIYLSRITCKQPALQFSPSCSSSFVVSICFHPNRNNIFVLGFEDGTIAAYDATPLPTSQFTDERFSYAKIYGEISHIKGLHSQVNNTFSLDKPLEARLSNTTNVLTISGIQFLPRRLCSVISVGADRNCFVINFQKDGRKKAEIVDSWDIRATATSLAILELSDIPLQTDGQDDDDAEADNVLLAVGKSDGMVNVYNNSGQLLVTKDFSKDGRILDLEWAQRSKNQFLPVAIQPSSETKVGLSKPQLQQQHKNEHSNMSSPPKSSCSPPKIMVKLHVKTPPPDDYLLHGRSSTSSIGKLSSPGSPSVDGNAISVPGKQQHLGSQQSNNIGHGQDTDIDSLPPEDYITAPETKSNASYRSRSRRSSRTTTSSAGTSASRKRRSIPVVPSRPVPRPGGKLALRGRRPSIAVGSLAHRKVVQTPNLKQFRFENDDHDLPAPPKFHQRYPSSNISPRSEVPKPSSPVNHTRSHSGFISPLALETPATPIQYTRLGGPSLDAAPSTSMSKQSGFHESDFGLRPAIPVKISELQKDSTPKVGMSGSSTSTGSLLEWTPSAHLPTNTPRNRAPSLFQAKTKERIPPVTAPIQRQNLYQESDSSPASQLEWHDNRKPIEVAGFDMLNPSQLHKTPSAAEKAKQTDKRRSIPISPLAPLQNFKLRRRQTTINLKDKNEPATESKPEESTPTTISEDTALKPLPLAPLRSNPSPVKQPPFVSASVLLHEPPPPSSPGPASIQLPSIPDSTNIRTARTPSSQLKSTLNSRQVRSSNSTAGWQSTYTIEDVIRIECAAVCTRIDTGFDEHKAWLQGLLREHNWYALRLEEENRLLREEMARLRR